MTTPTPPQPSVEGARPWWKKKRFVLPIGGVVFLMVLSPFVPDEEATSESANETTTSTQRDETTTTVEATTTSTESASTTASTTEAPTTTEEPTTTSGSSAAERCDGGGAPFDTTAGITCDEVIAEAERVMKAFDELGDVQTTFATLTAGTVCLAATRTEPMTYEPESTYIPAVADALIGPYCPGDRDMLILNG